MSLDSFMVFAAQHPYLIPLFPFLAFLLITASGLGNRKLAPTLSICAIFLSFLVSLGLLLMRLQSASLPPVEQVYQWFTVGSFRVEIGFLIDNLTTVMVTMVSLVAGLIQIYSLGYMEHESNSGLARFYCYISLFVASMLMLVLANNFIQIYICWELVGLCSYLLIGFWYQKKTAADAAKKAFIVTRFGDLGFLIGIISLATITGSFNFLQIQSVLPMLAAGQIFIIALLIFCGAVGKSAQFPLQIWLPDAMEGPTPVSALIHAATMVAAGVFLVARLYSIFALAPQALLVVAYIGAVTAFLAATIALVQSDIKKVLAYSTISQLGFMMLALGVGGYSAGTFHLLTHAFFKALLFLCAGSVIHAVHSNDMWQMGGLGKKMPITGITYLVGCLAIAGIPPFAGFFSKDEIIANLMAFAGHPVLKILILPAVLMTAYYMFRSYILTFCGPSRGNLPAKENRPVMTVPLIILAFFAAFIGLIGLPGKNLFAEFINFGGHIAEPGGHLAMYLSLILSVLGILMAVGFYLRKPEVSENIFKKHFSLIYRFLENKWYMDDFWTGVVKFGPFLAARICSWLDTYIVDGLVRGTGSVTYKLGELLRYEHSGKVQQYAVMIIIFLAMVLLSWQYLFRILPVSGILGG